VAAEIAARANNGKKADEVDQRGAREGAEPIGNLGIVEAVMDGDDGCRYRQRADNAGVERLNASLTVIPLAGVKDDGYLSPRLSPLSLMISLKKKQ